MATSLGNLFLHLKLSHADFDRDLERMKKTALKVGQDVEKQGIDLKAQLNTKELRNLDKHLDRYEREFMVKIHVDDKRLFDLNDHFALKEKDHKKLQKKFDKPLKPNFDTRPFDKFDKSLVNVNTRIRESRNELQTLKNTAASIKIAGDQKATIDETQTVKVEVDATAIARSFKDSTKDLGDNIAQQTAKGVKKANQKNPFKLVADAAISAPKTIVRGFYEGVGITYSQELTKGFIKGIEGKFNASLENVGKKSGEKILAGGQKIGDRLLKKMGIAEGFKGLKPIASEVNAALKEIIPVDVLEERLGQVEDAIGRVLDGLLELDQAATTKGLQGLGKALGGVGSIPVEGIDRRRSRILQNSAQMARARAEELRGTIPTVAPDAKRIMIVSGGFAGVKGKSSQSVSERFGLVAGNQAAIDYIDNEETDTTANLGKAPKWLAQILSRFGKQNVVQGYNKDAIEAAAKALAYQQQNPNLPINFVGYSGGGYVAKEAVEILGAAGVQSKGVGIGTPMFGLTGRTKADQFQAYMGQNDPLSKLAPALRSPNLKILKEAGAGHKLSNYLGGADLQKELDRFFGMKSQAVSAVEIELHGFEEQVSELAEDITKVLADPKQAQFFKKTGLYQAQLSSIQSHRRKLAGLIGNAEGEIAEQIEQYDEALAEMEGFMRQSYGVRGDMAPAVKATAEQKAIARPRVEAPPKVEAPVAPPAAAMPEAKAVKAEATEAKQKVAAIAKAAEAEDKAELEAVKAELNKYTVDILREFSRVSGRGGAKGRKEDLINDLMQNVRPTELDRVIESVKPQISVGAKGGLRLKKIAQSPQEKEFVAGIKQVEREINDEIAKLDQYQGQQRDEFLKTLVAQVDAQVAHLDNIAKDLQAPETRLEAGRSKGRLEQTYRQLNPEVRRKQSAEFKQQLGERSPTVGNIELARFNPPSNIGNLVQGNALTTYRAILESMAKASNVALDPKNLPKLVVDDAKLQKVGAKALYNIKRNIITIGSEIEEILEEGAEALEANAAALADIVHESRHAFQFNFGKSGLNSLSYGVKQPGVNLISDEYVDPRTRYAASKSAEFASSQVAGGLPKKSQQKFYELEIDAYAFERHTPKIVTHAANQLRENEAQFATAPQAFDDTRLITQFKAQTKAAFTYLIEQVKLLTSWIDKLRTSTSGVVEGIRGFVSNAASAVGAIAQPQMVAAKFNPSEGQPNSAYQAIFENVAKASKTTLDPKKLPQLIVDDARLEKTGRKALYDIKQNAIIITSEIEGFLKGGARSLEKNAESLTSLVHESRRAFQFDFGRIGIPGASLGKRLGVELIPEEGVDPKVKGLAQRSTELESSQARMTKLAQKTFYKLEVDAYAFESQASKIIGNAIQKLESELPQASAKPLGETESPLLASGQPAIELLVKDFKTRIKDVFTYLIEQVKLLTSWVEKFKALTAGGVEGVRNFASNAVNKVSSVVATPQVAAKFDPDAPDIPAAPQQPQGRRVKRGSRIRNIVANVVGEETAQSLDRTSGVIANLPAMANKATDAIADLISEFANFAAQQAQNLPGGGLISKFLEDSGRLAKFAKPLLITLGGFAILGAITQMFAGLANVVTPVALEFEKFNRILSFTEGSAAKGAAQIGRIREQSRALGTDVKQAIGGYTQLAAAANETSLEGAATEQLQTALETASAAYALDTESQQRLYLASSQVISKGSVSSEEIRQQIGEVLPGAYQIASRSMGMTGAQFSKQLQLGNVQSADFIPKFSQQLQAELSVAAASGADSAQASINRMNSAITELQATVGAGILPVQKLGFDAAAQGARLLTDNVNILLMGIGALSIQFGGVLSSSLIKAIAGIAGVKTAIVTMTGALRAVANAAGSLAKSFLWITLATDLIGIFSKATEDGAGSVRTFADQTEESYNKYLELTGRATEETNKFRNAFESLNDLKAPSLLENSLTGNALKTVLGEQSGSGLARMIERSLQGNGIGGRIMQSTGLGFIGARINEMRGGEGLATYAEQQANDLIIAANESAATIEQIYSEAYSMLGTDGQGVGDLGAMLRIDEELKQIQAQRQVLRPEDDAGRRALQEQERTLLAEREQASQSVGAIQGQLATYEAGLEDTRAKLEEMLAYGNELPPEVQEQLKNRLEQTNRQIEENQKMQARFTRAINTSADAAKRLQREFQGIGDRLTDANSAASLQASQDRLATAQAQLNNELTPGEAQYQGAIDAQEALNTRIRNNTVALQEYNATVQSVQVQDALKQAEIDPSMGIEAMRSKVNQLTESQPNTEFSDNLKTALNAYEQIQTLTLETADLESQMADSQVQAKTSLEQSARQVSDFFRQITRSTEDLINAVEKSNLGAEVLEAKNALQAKLSPFSGRFFSDFVSGFGELLDLIFQPLQNALDLRSQIQGINNQRMDQAMQFGELQRNLYGGGMGQGMGAAADVREVATGTLAAQEYGASRSGGARRHAGQDLDYGESDYAQSFIGGVVTRIGSDPGGYGNYIDVFNSALGVVERIAEFDTTLVQVGQQLAPGQNVGQGTQDTGVIHYEIRTDVNGQGQGGSGFNGTVDPIAFLEEQGIFRREGDRLIPLQGNIATVDLSEHVHFPGDGHSHDMADFGLAQGAGGASNAMQMDFSNLTVKGVAADAEQIQNAQIIAQVGQSLGATMDEIGVAIATAIQESELRNLTGGDRDSLGLFQQRPSMEWGSREQISDPRFASESFFVGRGSNIGLLDTRGTADLFERSHDVQRSAHPDAPRRWAQEGMAIAQSVSGNAMPMMPGMPQQGMSPQQLAMANQGMSAYNSAADSQIQALQRQIAAQDAQAAIALDQAIQRNQRALEDGTREFDSTLRDYRRSQEDAALGVIQDSPVGAVISESTQLSRELADKTQEQQLLLRDAQTDLENLQVYRDYIQEYGGEQLQPLLPGLDETIANTRRQIDELQSLVDQETGVYEQRRERILEEYRRQQAIEREQAQFRSFDLNLQLESAQAGLAGNQAGQTLIETRRNVAQAASGYDEQIRELERRRAQLEEYLLQAREAQQQLGEQQTTAIGGTVEDVVKSKVELDTEEIRLAEEELSNLNAQLDSVTSDRQVEIEIAMVQADQLLQDTQREMSSNLRSALAQQYENAGDPFSAAMIQERGAEIEETRRYQQQLASIQSMEQSGYYSAEAIAELRGQAEQLNSINLENIDSQFKDLGETVVDIGKNALGTFFSDILSGSKSAGEAFRDLLAGMAQQLAQLAANALISEIFGGQEGYADQDGSALLGGTDSSGSPLASTDQAVVQSGQQFAQTATQAGQSFLTAVQQSAQVLATTLQSATGLAQPLGATGFGTMAQPGLVGLTSAAPTGGLFSMGGLQSAAQQASFTLQEGVQVASMTLADAGSMSSTNLLGGLETGLPGIVQGIGSLFGGGGGKKGMGGGGGLLSGLLGGLGGGGGIFGTLLSVGSSLLGFKEGGVAPKMDHSAYREMDNPIGEALRREGSNSILAALTPGERILSLEETKRFEQMEVYNYARGGIAGSNRSVPKFEGGGVAVNNNVSVPVNVSVTGGSGEEGGGIDQRALASAVEATVVQQLLKQNRPGGVNYRR